MKKLTNKVAIITGAGSGIGKAVALKFANEEAKIVVIDIDVKNGEEVEKMIKEKGGNAIFIKADVSKKSEVISMIKEVLGSYGRIDILFNNAAIEKAGKITDLSEDDWDRAIETNLKSVFLCSKYVIPEMVKNKSGVIINNASGLGISGGEGVAAYAASKGAIITLTKCMAKDHSTQNIRVNCICPGAIDTPLLKRFATKEELKTIVKESEFKRLGTPDEVANLVLFLASSESSLITGSIINVGIIT